VINLLLHLFNLFCFHLCSFVFHLRIVCSSEFLHELIKLFWLKSILFKHLNTHVLLMNLLTHTFQWWFHQVNLLLQFLIYWIIYLFVYGLFGFTWLINYFDLFLSFLLNFNDFRLFFLLDNFFGRLLLLNFLTINLILMNLFWFSLLVIFILIIFILINHLVIQYFLLRFIFSQFLLNCLLQF